MTDRGATGAPVVVALIPHTHWDREWWAPFEAMRVRLVETIDDLLARHAAGTAGTSRFLLDGQTAALDDYLAVRPERTAQVRELVASGRIRIGPWTTLPDEFCVSGETLVRNLQRGLARADELGGAMAVGYLPDAFGHAAQMPQLLRLVGIDHAVVWRGVPAAVQRQAFWWEAPDGSRVRAEHLYGSYANGAHLGAGPEGLVDRAHSYEVELGPARLDGGALLILCGGDHQPFAPGLDALAATATGAQDRYSFVVTSFPEHLPGEPVEGLGTWRGELRSGARANLLMGVLSNRVDLHQAAAAAERAVEQGAEPLCALLVPPAEHPTSLLDLAWRELVLNSAHDSACGCSTDEVVDTVLARYRGVRAGAEALRDRAVAGLAARLDRSHPEPRFVVVNPTRATRAGVVTLEIPGDGQCQLAHDDGDGGLELLATQLLGVTRPVGLVAQGTGTKLAWLLERMRGHQLGGVPIAHVEHHRTDDDGHAFELRAAAPGEPTVDLAPVRTEIERLTAAGAVVRVEERRPPIRTVQVATGPVPGFGWRTLRCLDGDPEPTPGPLRAGQTTLENEHLRVEVDTTLGTLSLRTHDGVEVHGIDRLVDGGDGGDTYNHSPPTRDETVGRPTTVGVALVEAGPARATLRVRRTYHLPEHAVGDEWSCDRRSEHRVPVEIDTTVELRVGEPFVRLSTALDHHVRDHRLRSHFPLPAPVTGSAAECAYAVVERGLHAEGGPHETALATFPSRRFVDCSDGARGLALLHDGLLEYEVLPPSASAPHGEVALTLLRAVGYLSRLRPALRPNPAGPARTVPGAQVPGHRVLRYAVLPHRGDWRTAGLHAAADRFLVDLVASPIPRGPGGEDPAVGSPPTVPDRGQALAVEGAEVSAVLRDAGRLVVRIHNPAPAPTRVTISWPGGPARGRHVDLRGAVLAGFDGSMTLEPAQIATLALDPE